MTTIIYLAILLGAFFLAKWIAKPQPLFRPYLTGAMALALVLALVVQLSVSSYLPFVERVGDELASGQWWRLLTALFGQDGGLVGGISNIVFLILVGCFAESLLGWRRWLLLYFGTGILAEVAALYLQPVGAGNSVANFGLAAGVFVWYALRPAVKPVHRLLLLCAMAGALLLLSQGDIHGAAFLIGCFLAVASFTWSMPIFGRPAETSR